MLPACSLCAPRGQSAKRLCQTCFWRSERAIEETNGGDGAASGAGNQRETGNVDHLPVRSYGLNEVLHAASTGENYGRR